MSVPAWVDPETWLPFDYETASDCATCGCSKASHVGAWDRERNTPCIYSGRHPDLDCRRYAAEPVLGL